MDQSSQQIGIKAFKVILVGAQAVGKSSILGQLINSQLPPSYQATVGIDYHTYTATVNSKPYSLQIWDTAGQEKFRALTATYYKSCNGCLCVYDLSDPESVDKCDYYLTKAAEQNIPDGCTFLVANKLDLIEDEEPQKNQTAVKGLEKAEKFGVNHRIVSAKSGSGILQLFEQLASKMVVQYGGAVESNAVQLLPKLKIVNKQGCNC